MDNATLTRHCLQSAMLVGLAAPTVWCGEVIWKGGRDDTKLCRDCFRLFGLVFFLIFPSILFQYVATGQFDLAGFWGFFAAGVWALFALPLLRALRRRFGPNLGSRS
jgi:hypothetical protein